jgi:hypothetical protein
MQYWNPLLKIIKGNRRIYIHTYLHQVINYINGFKNAMIVIYFSSVLMRECIVRYKVLFVYFYYISMSLPKILCHYPLIWVIYEARIAYPSSAPEFTPRVFVGSMFLIVVVFCVVLCFALWKCLSISLRMW